MVKFNHMKKINKRKGYKIPESRRSNSSASQESKMVKINHGKKMNNGGVTRPRNKMVKFVKQLCTTILLINKDCTKKFEWWTNKNILARIYWNRNYRIIRNIIPFKFPGFGSTSIKWTCQLTIGQDCQSVWKRNQMVREI